MKNVWGISLTLVMPILVEMRATAESPSAAVPDLMP